MHIKMFFEGHSHQSHSDRVLHKYSKLSNNRGVSNKRMVACNFLDLLHENERFW